MKHDEITTTIHRKWSRSHGGKHPNFLMIEETAYSYTLGVMTDLNKRAVVAQGYEVDSLKSLKSENVFDTNHWIYECMDPKNVATKDYKYYMISFANGRQIICQSWDEFLTIMREEEEKRIQPK